MTALADILAYEKSKATQYTGQSLVGIKLTGLKLRKNYNNQDFTGASFTRVEFYGEIDFACFEQATFDHCTFGMQGPDCEDAEKLVVYTGLNFKSATLKSCVFPDKIKFKATNAFNVKLDNCWMDGCDWGEANFDDAVFSTTMIDTSFTRCSMRNAIFTNSCFDRCNFDSADLTRADIASAKWKFCSFYGAVLANTPIREALIIAPKGLGVIGYVGYHRQLLYGVAHKNDMMIHTGSAWLSYTDLLKQLNPSTVTEVQSQKHHRTQYEAALNMLKSIVGPYKDTA